MRVVGQLLRGDRLLAHLLGLGQDLQVARQPRRHAQREPVVRLAVLPSRPIRARRSGSWKLTRLTLSSRSRERDGVHEVLEEPPPRPPPPPGSAPRSARLSAGSSDTSTSSSSKRALGPRPPRPRRGPRRRGGSRACRRGSRGPSGVRPPRRGVERQVVRDRAAARGSARRRRSSPRCRCRARSAASRSRSTPQRLDRSRAAPSSRPRRRRSPAARSRSRSSAWPHARPRARPRSRAGRRRRGRRGGARASLAQVAHPVEQRGLEPAEAEVELARSAAREVERVRVALARQPVDLRAARIAEAEQARALVERLAGGVVEASGRGPVATAGSSTRARNVCPPLATRHR